MQNPNNQQPNETTFDRIHIVFIRGNRMVGQVAANPLAGRDDHQPPQAEARQRLTPREWQVLQLLAEGLSNKDIAQRLSIEPVTVKKHVSNLMTKLGVHKRPQAISLALRQGWL